MLVSDENGLLGDRDVSRPVALQRARRWARTVYFRPQIAVISFLIFVPRAHGKLCWPSCLRLKNSSTLVDDLKSFIYVLYCVAMGRLPRQFSKTEDLKALFSEACDYAFTIGEDNPRTRGGKYSREALYEPAESSGRVRALTIRVCLRLPRASGHSSLRGAATCAKPAMMTSFCRTHNPYNLCSQVGIYLPELQFAERSTICC